MNKTNTVMVAIFVALGLTLVAGLIAIPTIENAHALTTGGLSLGDRLDIFFGLRNSIISGLFGP